MKTDYNFEVVVFPLPGINFCSVCLVRVVIPNCYTMIIYPNLPTKLNERIFIILIM